MVDDKLSAQIDFAKWIIDHNQSWINLVDTKAGVILAADAAILILLGGSSLSVNSVYDRILLEVTLTLVSASALFGFMVITPRTKAGAPATNIFFASILTKSREEYQNGFPTSPEQILQDCVDNIYTLSIIQSAKWAYLLSSLHSLLLGLLPLVGIVLLRTW